MGQHESRIEAAIFDQKGRKLRVIGINQSFHAALAHRGQLVDSDGQIIHGFSGVLAMKVAGRDDLASVREHDGVVGAGVHLDGDDAAHEVDGVVRNAVHLGATPQRVRILNSITKSVAF